MAAVDQAADLLPIIAATDGHNPSAITRHTIQDRSETLCNVIQWSRLTAAQAKR